MFGGNQAASGQTQLSRSALDEHVHSDYTVRNGAAHGLWSGKTPSQRLRSRLTRSLQRLAWEDEEEADALDLQMGNPAKMLFDHHWELFKFFQ